MRQICLLLLVVFVSGCGSELSTQPSSDNSLGLSQDLSKAEERRIFHKIQINFELPLTFGDMYLYRLMNGQTEPLEKRRFNSSAPEIHFGYSAPASASESVVLVHIVTAGLSAGIPQEYVCFAHLDHATSRHSFDVACDLSSTVPYYLSTVSVGRSENHPFHDIDRRYPLWRSMVESDDNDVIGFYQSVLGTLQNALTDMGSKHFRIGHYSIRPVMETISAQFMDVVQRRGSASSKQLIRIANDVTDNRIPIERLTRFETILDKYAYIADVELQNTGGSLVRRSGTVELLSLESEVFRFFVRSSPFEMSDYRTHLVQELSIRSVPGHLIASWEPIPHMYGYNTYLNGTHIAYSRLPAVELPPGSTGSLTVKAVGFAGEFDGAHHDIQPTLFSSEDSYAFERN